MQDFKPKKQFGQHFLQDDVTVARIVEAGNLKPNEVVWEIGPGKGVLTKLLLDKHIQLTAFEIDYALQDYIDSKFGESITLIRNDVLQVNWNELFPTEQVKIVANLPYQITSPFLFMVADHSSHFSLVVVMIQKEVAKRIQAGPGSKEYGPLSLKLQYYFTVEYLFSVPPEMFKPMPKVDSAVIRLRPRLDKPEVEDISLYWRIIQTAFEQRRKTLRNNWNRICSAEEMNSINNIIDLSRRGETLSEEEFLAVYHFLYSNRPSHSAE